VFGGAQMTGTRFTTTPNNWRRMAHKIADEIYKRVTGEDGYFDTRIVYISESGPKDKRQKQLAIMDQDGENHKNLTDGSVLVLTPRFSPAAQDITYHVLLQQQAAGLSLQHRQRPAGGARRLPGMTFAPRFSPDGSRVIMSMAQGGNTDISPWTSAPAARSA
jgi:TolB protein